MSYIYLTPWLMEGAYLIIGEVGGGGTAKSVFMRILAALGSAGYQRDGRIEMRVGEAASLPQNSIVGIRPH